MIRMKALTFKLGVKTYRNQCLRADILQLKECSDMLSMCSLVHVSRHLHTAFTGAVWMFLTLLKHKSSITCLQIFQKHEWTYSFIWNNAEVCLEDASSVWVSLLRSVTPPTARLPNYISAPKNSWFHFISIFVDAAEMHIETHMRGFMLIKYSFTLNMFLLLKMWEAFLQTGLTAQSTRVSGQPLSACQQKPATVDMSVMVTYPSRVCLH